MDVPHQPRIYAPAERPAIEVEINGQWYAGELRAWLRRGDEWWANVAWSAGVADTRLETVAAERVRLVEE